eukprot:TRINITY_DN59915_c0_g1_i1.p1 TRINITY_DN59915_c0_g1~~TRINITY_DN59915_c0_g1_i1.p1  ORF type:complete len:884 (+),score=293.61 TRINITY_DN59915_c0_g1_i1:87-2654(+)
MPLLLPFSMRRGRRPRRLSQAVVLGWCAFAVAIFVVALVRTVPEDGTAGAQRLTHGGRHLLNWNPMSTDPEEKGPLGTAGIGLWLVLLVWLFAGVAVVTDAYFTPALEAISNALGLSEDVAGATFLAAASSAPEFFTSLADTFASDGSGLGIGTIVGSAVFNMMVIVALSCIPCDCLNLDWYPLIRDSFFYVISIACLLAFVVTGSAWKEDDDNPPRVFLNGTLNNATRSGETVGLVEWYESLILVLGYVAYIVYMKFSGAMRPRVVRWKDALFSTNESGDFPEHDTQADFQCQVVQLPNDQGDLELVSTRAGSAAAAATRHSLPYGHCDAMEPSASPDGTPRVNAEGAARRGLAGDSNQYPHAHSRADHPNYHASIPTPRVRKHWAKEQDRWQRRQMRVEGGDVDSKAASQQGRPQPSAFTQWVIQQRRIRDEQDDGRWTTPRYSAQSAMGSPRTGKTPRTPGRRGSPKRLLDDQGPLKADPSPPPPNSPSSEHLLSADGVPLTEQQHRIMQLEKQKDEAKACDDLVEALRLKRLIEALKRGEDPEAEESDDDDCEEKVLTLTKKEFDDLRSTGHLLLEEDDGDGEAGEGDGELSVKVAEIKSRAEVHGFVEDMEIARINSRKVKSLDDIDRALADVGISDTITVLTKLEKEDDFWDLDWPDDQFRRLLWIPVIPLVLLFKLTIPRADRRATKRYYWVAFVISIVWIGILSMYMLKFASWIGAILSIDPIVMGTVVLAAGTSVPDAMGSYCAAKMGMADMAVSNALGSNVFNIFAGLGFPWFLSSVIDGKPVQVSKKGIVIPTLILLAVLVFFLYTLRSFNFQLRPKVGKIFMCVMVLYWTWTLLNEFVFGIEL